VESLRAFFLGDRFAWLGSGFPIFLGLALAGVAKQLLAFIHPQQRAKSVVLLVPIAIPLLLLMAQEIKHSRYLYYFALPPLVFMGAEFFVSQLRRLHLSDTTILAASCLLITFPYITTAGNWRLATIELMENIDARISRRDFLTQVQLDYLRPRLQAGDQVVTSYDAPSLSYHLQRRVYGMLNTRRTDVSLMQLLTKTNTDDQKVWFVDFLPGANACMTGTAVPLHIDCRQKFPRFYKAFTDPAHIEPACRRLTIAQLMSAAVQRN